MSWRCAGLFSLPILCLYVGSFFLTAWEDHDGVYLGYETIGNSFERVGRAGDLLGPMLLLLPNVCFVAGVVLLAMPKTWARIVAAALGLFALAVSVGLAFGAEFGSIIQSIFHGSAGPGQIREGFFVWTGSMFLLMLVGLVTAIVSGTRPGTNQGEDHPRRGRRYEDDYDDDYDDDIRRRRFERERWRRERD